MTADLRRSGGGTLPRKNMTRPVGLLNWLVIEESGYGYAAYPLRPRRRHAG